MKVFYATVSKDWRITIPAKIRKEFGLVAGTVISFNIEGDSLVLRVIK